MANVTDPNFWPQLPFSNPEPAAQSLPPRVSPIEDRSERAAREALREHEQADGEQAVLSLALRHVFDRGGDRIVWNASPDASTSQPLSDPFLRFDASHGDERHAPAGPLGAAHFSNSDDSRPEAWLVIVDRAENLVADNRGNQLQAAREEASQLLLVACESQAATRDRSEAGSSAALGALSEQFNCEYVGPVLGRDLRSLVEVLRQIKQHGRPVLLHVRTVDGNASQTLASDEEPRDGEPRAGVALSLPTIDGASSTEPIARGGDVLRQVASEELAELARHDERIAVVSTTGGAEFARPWESLSERLFPVTSDPSSALRWSASLAASGSHPFVFLSCEEAQDGFGPIRREICLPGAAVTLVVAAGSTTDDARFLSSAALAGFRQLPNLAILSPKDVNELRQMLAWCASQAEPSLVWLPQTVAAPRPWPRGAEIARGRAEELIGGEDVAIVAWGPTVAAAAAAAELLAGEGVRAGVVNARFAQPLDVDTIGRAVRGALCVVLVADSDEPGGFLGWVLEQLLAVATTQPVSVVAPQTFSIRQMPQDAHDCCVRAIVDRCRWLASPVAAPLAIETRVPVEGVGSHVSAADLKSGADRWLEFRATRAQSMVDERAQVYARQLSRDAWRWVRAYEKVGSRDLYLWKWCMHGVALTTLPGVAPEFRAHVCDTKLLSIVLCVLLDDVADQHGDDRLLDVLLELPCTGATRSLRGLSAAAKRHAEVTRHVWSEYQARIASYPCYAAYEPLLRFDLLQFFNTMRYSHLVNSRPYLLNMAEHDLYTSHNMMMISFSTLDLMCSPGFPSSEVGLLREAMWHAQCMGRIGNLLSTWRRELVDRDFTSGLFARAVMEGDLTLDELEHGDLTDIESIIRLRGHESHFFRKWTEHRELCHARARRIRSCDLHDVLEGHDRFFAMHMGSQGLI